MRRARGLDWQQNDQEGVYYGAYLEQSENFPVFKATFCVNALFWQIHFLITTSKRFRFEQRVDGAPHSTRLALRGSNNFCETAKDVTDHAQSTLYDSYVRNTPYAKQPD